MYVISKNLERSELLVNFERHKASRGLSAAAELLVLGTTVRYIVCELHLLL